MSDPHEDGRARRRFESGSATLLVPALLLLTVLLAAIAVDLSHLRQSQHEARDLARAAANDAVGAAVDTERLRSGHRAQLDPARAAAVARRAVQRSRPGALRVTAVDVAADHRSVAVTLTATIPMIFSAALPGRDGSATVTGRARAHLVVR